MKLLFDQNLSHRLIHLLNEPYPNSEHVRNVGMTSSEDETIWDYSKTHEYVLVTKDEDFHIRSILFRPPPKVLWTRSGNCSTDLVESLLRKDHAEIEGFVTNSSSGFLVLQ